MGTGGIGQNVALNLGRLGVKRIIMLDFDTYDASNVTRQCLGGLDDVGKYKVDIAAANIGLHNLRSEIETINVNAITEWPRVVEAASRSHVMFNCVDVGTMFDVAISSLAQHFNIPCIQGQSYTWQFSVEFYSGKPGKRCFGCTCADLRSYFQARAKTIDEAKFGTFIRFQTWAAAQTPALNELDAKDVAKWLGEDERFKMDGESTLEVTTQALAALNIPTLQVESKALLAFLEQLTDVVTERMLCDNIVKLADLNFIPRPKHPPTRFYGSWVCPCLACGTMMVSQFVNSFTGPGPKDPPSIVDFDLSNFRGLYAPFEYSTDDSNDKCK